MKKIFTILLMMCIASSAFAQKTVSIIWPFSPASSQSNMVRAVIESANAQQNKYQFVFQNRPGAGGAIAANAVKESKELAILATTSSFYIRPLLYKDSHSIDDFDLVTPFCNAQPLAIFSKKINKLSDAQHRDITIGVNPGSITSLITRSLKRENPEFSIVEVPYKGTPEATTDMLGGHIDGGVDWMGPSVTARFTNDVKVVGMTGTRSVNGHQTFQSQKIKGLENITVGHYFFVNKTIDNTTRQELHKILSDALTEKSKSICEIDFGQLVKTPYNQLDSVNQTIKTNWEKLTAGIAKE
jgi:tripartite-type tricarboxylate transporter receptor subunit TctC